MSGGIPMDPVAAIVVAIIGGAVTIAGVLLNDRREHRNAAAATADRIEAAAAADRKEMELALRERLTFKDEQIKARDERIAELVEKVRSLGGAP